MSRNFQHGPQGEDEPDLRNDPANKSGGVTEPAEALGEFDNFLRKNDNGALGETAYLCTG